MRCRSADTNYFVTASVSGTANSPAEGSTRVHVEGKMRKQFTIKAEVPPGAASSGKSATIDWHLV